VFDPFFTTKNSGSGLGLALVHELATRHNGGIRMHSEPGQRTVFQLSLPRKQPERESA
jgi:signal transduction histidine kinase